MFNSQKNPFVLWTGHSYLISWEDSRLTSGTTPREDIFFQELRIIFMLII